MSSRIIFKGLRYNGLWWVADFKDKIRNFCLKTEDLRIRIENLKKDNRSYEAEATALALLEAKIKEEEDEDE
jgi:hypothetical protein